MTRPRQRRSRRWIAGAVLVLALGGAGWWWRPGSPEAVGGTPRLVLDREVLDFGYLPFETPVRAVFQLINTGNGTLRLVDVPRVAVLDGC